MSVSINPGTFNNRKLFDSSGKADQAEFSKLFNDLSQWAQQIQANLSAPLYLAGILNGNSAVFGSALLLKNVSLVNVATNQTVDCTGAADVTVYMSINTAVNLTLTLNNLALGVPIQVTFDNEAAGTQTFKLACNTPVPSAYTIRAIQAGGGAVDLTASGVAPLAGHRAVFGSAGTPGPQLFGILQS